MSPTLRIGGRAVLLDPDGLVLRTLAELRGTAETILPPQLAGVLGGLSSVGDASA